MDIYTDGAFSPNRKTCGLAFIVVENGEIIYKYNKKVNGGDNIIAEMLAILMALRSIISPIDNITLYSDNAYCVNVLNGEWNTDKYLNIWEQINKAKESALNNCSHIQFKWIHGHSGITFNEIVDELAVIASRSV